MNCPNCGAPVDIEKARCQSCGYELQGDNEPAATTRPEFDSSLNQPRKRRIGLIVGVAAAVVVVGSASAAAAVLHPFASGKNLLLMSVQQASPDQAQSGEETWHLKLKDLHADGLGQPTAGLVETLNNSSIDLGFIFLPQDKQLAVTFTTQYQSIAHKGALWLTKDQFILDASDYQSLLAPVIQGVKLPKYLVTSADEAQPIKDFWSQLDSASLTAQQVNDVRDLETLIIEAIPDKYIHRTGLSTIEISFDQQGLQDILQSEVKAVYQNKDRFANDISGLASLSKAPDAPSPTQVKQQILDGLNQVPVEAVLAGVSTAFNSGVLSIEPMSITVTKSWFGGQVTSHFQGGFSVKDPQSNASATIEFSIDGHTPAQSSVQLPTVSAGNSQTFTDWAQQANQAGAGQ